MLPPVPAFRARDFRQARMGHHDNSRCDEPGRRQHNLRSPGISDRTPACAVRISGERCEFGEGYCGNVGEMPIRIHITYTCLLHLGGLPNLRGLHIQHFLDLHVKIRAVASSGRMFAALCELVFFSEAIISITSLSDAIDSNALDKIELTFDTLDPHYPGLACPALGRRVLERHQNLAIVDPIVGAEIQDADKTVPQRANFIPRHSRRSRPHAPRRLVPPSPFVRQFDRGRDPRCERHRYRRRVFEADGYRLAAAPNAQPIARMPVCRGPRWPGSSPWRSTVRALSRSPSFWMRLAQTPKYLGTGSATARSPDSTSASRRCPLPGPSLLRYFRICRSCRRARRETVISWHRGERSIWRLGRWSAPWLKERFMPGCRNPCQSIDHARVGTFAS
ncbi:hypothetical protein B0H14DRAFT_1492936 [Mycena olivaceomarginata]|nr:hypothetical protein B0H14DRAFT_1492936 [Mycena olivaceomarginata]